MPKTHGTLPASSSGRWLACTPSAMLEKQFPEEVSPYAEEGTAAHEVAEKAARFFLGELTEDEFNTWKKQFSEESSYYNQEMLEAATGYAQLVFQKYRSLKSHCPDALVELETRLDFSKWVKQGFGTGDCVIIADGGLEIVDFKYGKGHRVSAEGNSQMRLYALGALAAYEDFYDVHTVTMTIYQPRLSSGESQETMTVKDLQQWAKEVVVPRAKLAYKGEGEFAPSEETCKFCKAKAVCRARAQMNMAVFDEAPDPTLLSLAEASELLAKASDIKAWLGDLEELVFSSLMKGETAPGWKIVEGRSVRKLGSEDDVVKAMTDAGYDESLLYERKLLTLTQMEKDFGKKTIDGILKDLIVKPQGKPSLAPESDPRPAIDPESVTLSDFDK